MITALILALAASTGDPVLDDLDGAFASLRHGDHARAHTLLERATARFEDLELDGSALEKAFASDADKPYRGRPHERVFAEAILAALDIENGRCDLAIPSLQEAALLDAKQSPKDTSDAVLVHALALRCLVEMHAADADIGRAADDLESAAGKRAVDVERRVLAPDAKLALDGIGPTVRADGSNGERAVIVPSLHPAPNAVVDETAARDAVVIRLGAHASSTSAVAAHAKRGRHARDARPLEAGTPSRGIVVWSSTFQATTVQGRPYDAVLADRSRFRSDSIARGTGMMKSAASTVTTPVLDARHAVAGILYAGAGAGLTAVGAVTDARADVRFVDSLFERAILE